MWAFVSDFEKNQRGQLGPEGWFFESALGPSAGAHSSCFASRPGAQPARSRCPTPNPKSKAGRFEPGLLVLILQG